MPITRQFLDWNKPALPAAADWLISRYASGDELDLSKVVLVFPGRRAARRMLELLVQRGGSKWPAMIPPRMVTFNQFPELLYPQKFQLADDLTQDVFVQLFRRLDQFRGESSFSTWVHRVALTVSLNAMRKVKRFRTRETEIDEAFHHENEADDAEPDFRERLNAAIDALPDGCRVALVMHTIEGYSHAEIGEMLGIAEGTSKARVFDARARLKKMLAPFLKERA